MPSLGRFTAKKSRGNKVTVNISTTRGFVGHIVWLLGCAARRNVLGLVRVGSAAMTNWWILVAGGRTLSALLRGIPRSITAVQKRVGQLQPVQHTTHRFLAKQPYTALRWLSSPKVCVALPTVLPSLNPSFPPALGL